jgi:integrase
LTAEHVEDHVYGCMRAELGLSETTVTQTHRILSRVLSVAVKRRRLPRNPSADLEDAPTPTPTETDVLTVEEVRRILEVVDARRNSARWHLALTLGLRQSETLGLEWGGLDDEHAVLVIRQDLERRTWQHGCSPHGEQPSCGRRRGADCPGVIRVD